MSDNLMDKIVSLCKRRGFIFQGSEIYGGLANTWDYGPLGVELKRNVKDAWWKENVQMRSDMVGLDAAILMHPEVWKASGHVKSFIDKYKDCLVCKKRIKADDPRWNPKKPNKCPECGNDGVGLTDAREFNLMLRTTLGALGVGGAETYLRPETAQGIFVNFSNILNTTRKKLPFGVAQIGKAFRNEVTPGNFTFRTREFEQMEIEYFVLPNEADKFYKQWINDRFDWYLKLGMKEENLKKREHKKEELAHYALACTDIEYKFPFGWSELEGIANRGDFDLRQHQDCSKKDLSYEKSLPFIIEPSGGVDRAILAFLVDAYREEEVRGQQRVVLGLGKQLAPIKVAVLPLLKKNKEIVDLCKRIAADLERSFFCAYDDTASIGRLYRRQDEIGTCYCVTVDVESLGDSKVTVRDRDSMKQDRIDVGNVGQYLKDNLG
ncbi:MAG: glycine--tRNA ligase [Candidatus Omnitrophica bacterium]|nr:glycine--tRNA ligase [Candidatus Omnitrophota bacterium]